MGKWLNIYFLKVRFGEVWIFLGQTVSFKCSDGVDMAAYVAAPKSEGKHPAIVVVHEAWGLNRQIKGVATDMRNKALWLAPHLFSRDKDLTEQAIEKAMTKMWQIPPEKRNDPAAIQNLMASLTRKRTENNELFLRRRENAEKTMAQDILCRINYAKSLEIVDGERLGITGFCLGGGLTYQLATQYPFVRLFPFTAQIPSRLTQLPKSNAPSLESTLAKI